MSLKTDLQNALEATLLRGEVFDTGAFLARIEDGAASDASSRQIRETESGRRTQGRTETPGRGA